LLPIGAQHMAEIIEKSAAVPRDLVWRLSVAQYHAMIRLGILTADDPVELLEGWLIPKMPKNPLHRATTRLIREALERVIPSGWYVDTQEPITTPDSEPEPDAVIVRGDTRQYLDRHPGPEDVALVVEVADTTLQRDRELKKRLYAHAGIAVYWLVNLSERQLEVYTEPSGPEGESAYASQRIYQLSDRVPLTIEGTEIGRLSLQELLP
jgi:Uma2 family endonuclease